MRNVCRTLTISLCAALLAAGTLTFADADARSISYDLNIPSEDLTVALQSFAIASHHKLLYKAELTVGKISRALKGHFTAQEAMEALLSGTGLSYEITGSSVVLIKDQPNAKTSELRDEGTTPSSPRAAPQSSGGQPILLAQVDQGKSTGDLPVGKSDDQTKNKKTEGLEEIIVTGTHIHNVAPISPVITITHDDIVTQGYSTLAQVFEQLPQNSKAGASAESNGWTGMGTDAALNFSFASGVNLRGLGPAATLVLLNGRRLATTPSGAAVDISQIPVSLIDHVDILTDGASAVYGSDAIAGVVNVITRKDYSGLEIGGRVNSITEGKTPNYGGNTLGGFSWASGNVVMDFDYEKDNALLNQNRSFTSAAGDSISLLPQNETESYYASLQQQFSDRLSLSGDMLLTQRKFYAHVGVSPGSPLPTTAYGTLHQYSGSLQLDYKVFSDWTATLLAQGSREQDRDNSFAPAIDYLTTNAPNDYKVYSLEPRLEGSLFDAWGGAVRMAIGGEFRHEDYDELLRAGTSEDPTAFTLLPISAVRHVSSAYGEMLVPLVGPDNALPLVRRLRIDVSGRYDDYSDFGRATNPKLGIEWVLIDGIAVHSSWGRSFHAPTLLQASNDLNSAFTMSVADTRSATGSSTVLETSTTGPYLQPETSKSFNLGASLQPAFAQGLKLDASYFYTTFDNRIIQLATYGYFTNVLSSGEAALGSLVQRNPTLAEINQALDAPGRTILNGLAGFCNVASPGCPPIDRTGISALVPVGFVNASSVTLKGVDLSAQYVGQPTRVGRFHADVDGTYMATFQQRLTPGASEVSPLNTVYNPLRFRAKTNVGWDQGEWGINARLNYSNSYSNTSAVDANCPGGSDCQIASWTTVDVSLAYTGSKKESGSFLSGLRVGVDVANLFNRAPPHVSSTFGYFPYDGVNANPLLRTIGINFTKKWGGT